jgi:hypothetical protein
MQLQSVDNTVHVRPIVVTTLGVLVDFSLHLRSSTAYERYMEGRKVWSRLNGISANLARNIWCHAKERKASFGRRISWPKSRSVISSWPMKSHLRIKSGLSPVLSTKTYTTWLPTSVSLRKPQESTLKDRISMLRLDISSISFDWLSQTLAPSSSEPSVL